jgi:site-specific DNA recombinase
MRFPAAVARAHQCAYDLLSGRARSIEEIAERERVGARYVRRMMRLAFLAPKIVEMIASGSQPPDLTAEALGRMMRLGFLAPEIVEAIAAGSQPPDLTAEALAERVDLPLL